MLTHALTWGRRTVSVEPENDLASFLLTSSELMVQIKKRPKKVLDGLRTMTEEQVEEFNFPECFDDSIQRLFCIALLVRYEILVEKGGKDSMLEFGDKCLTLAESSQKNQPSVSGCAAMLACLIFDERHPVSTGGSSDQRFDAIMWYIASWCEQINKPEIELFEKTLLAYYFGKAGPPSDAKAVFETPMREAWYRISPESRNPIQLQIVLHGAAKGYDKVAKICPVEFLPPPGAWDYLIQGLKVQGIGKRHLRKALPLIDTLAPHQTIRKNGAFAPIASLKSWLPELILSDDALKVAWNLSLAPPLKQKEPQDTDKTTPQLKIEGDELEQPNVRKDAIHEDAEHPNVVDQPSVDLPHTESESQKALEAQKLPPDVEPAVEILEKSTERTPMFSLIEQAPQIDLPDDLEQNICPEAELSPEERSKRISEYIDRCVLNHSIEHQNSMLKQAFSKDYLTNWDEAFAFAFLLEIRMRDPLVDSKGIRYPILDDVALKKAGTWIRGMKQKLQRRDIRVVTEERRFQPKNSNQA